MKRKVIQIANSTQLISLPRKWALKYAINKGDELEVTEQSNKLLITTEKEIEQNKITIDVKDLNPRMIKWVLTAVYKEGYDEVEILFDDPNVMEVIQDRLRELLGFMIIEHSQKRCLVKSISQGIEQEFDVTLRRAFLVTISMADSILELLKKGDNEHLKEITRLESTNNQLTNFCQRILNKKGYKDPKKTNNLNIIISTVENIADSYKFICMYLSSPKKSKISKQALSLIEDVNKMFADYYSSFYHPDDKKLVSISDARYKVPETAYGLMGKGSPAEIQVAQLMLEIFRKMIDSLDAYVGMRY